MESVVAEVYGELDEQLVILSKDSREPLLLLATDVAAKLASALLETAIAVEADMRASGKLIAPKENISGVWEVAVGYYEGGVAIQFNQAGTRVPLPPQVARALADRVTSAVNAAKTGTTIVTGKTPVKSFGPRPVTV